SKVANFVALVAFWGTWTIVVIVALRAQRLRSPIRFLFTRSRSVSPAGILPLVLLLLLALIVSGSVIKFSFILSLAFSPSVVPFVHHHVSGIGARRTERVTRE
nr:hypothetical protein [Tanacetum cinerariifolium]